MHASASSCAPPAQAKAKAPTTLPAGWKRSGTGRDERKEYNVQMATYRRDVAKRRNAWQPIVVAHNEKVEVLKAERKAAFLERQAEALDRQFTRWVSPRVLRTSQERRPDPALRQQAYARAELRSALVASAHAAVVDRVIAESAEWIEEGELDRVIERKLAAALVTASKNARVGLYEKVALPARDLYDVHECIAGTPSKRGPAKAL